MLKRWIVVAAGGFVAIQGLSEYARTADLSSSGPGEANGAAVEAAEVATAGSGAFAQGPPIMKFDPYNSGYPIERSECLTIWLGPSAAAECGNLRVVHQLPSTRVFNKERTPTLIYNSEFAHPWMVIPVWVKITSTTSQPDTVKVVLKVGKDTSSYLTRATKTWAGSEWPSGQTTTRRLWRRFHVDG